VLAAYNPYSRVYLVLWEPLPGGSPEINGQLLDSKLRPIGGEIHTTAYDFYLYDGNLAADPDTGEFLLAQQRRT
jgi:hypothetical protein